MQLADVVDLLKRHNLASLDPEQLRGVALRLNATLGALATYSKRHAPTPSPRLKKPVGRPLGGRNVIYLGELAAVFEDASRNADGLATKRARISKYTNRLGETNWGKFAAFATECFHVAGCDDVTEQRLAKAWIAATGRARELLKKRASC